MTILRYFHNRYICAAEVQNVNSDFNARLAFASVGMLVRIWIGSQHPHLNFERRSRMTLRDIVAFQYFPLILNVCFKLKP